MTIITILIDTMIPITLIIITIIILDIMDNHKSIKLQKKYDVLLYLF